MREYLVKIWSMIIRGKIKSLTQHFAARGYVPGLAPKIYVSFLSFITHLGSSDSIFEAEI